jgi:hypothetical protein
LSRRQGSADYRKIGSIPGQVAGRSGLLEQGFDYLAAGPGDDFDRRSRGVECSERRLSIDSCWILTPFSANEGFP